jgi:hypothetical protein
MVLEGSDPEKKVAAHFAAIASCVQERQPDRTLTALLAQTQLLCAEAAERERSADLKRLLTNVGAALQTWQQVWPRLGTRDEFRLAVAREARLWSKRFSD